MKWSLLLLPVVMVLPNMISCGVAHQSTESTERTIHHADVVEPKIHEGDPMSWEILFRKIPGIEVRGNYPRLSLRIRGAQSIHLTTEPLYVLEGIPLGHDFASLARATTPQEVKSIRILKGAEATMYGARGANGVVVVNLK